MTIGATEDAASCRIARPGDTALRPDSTSILGRVERLILARHGESEYSVQGLVNGDTAIDVGLTGAGAAQARALGGEPPSARIDRPIEYAHPYRLDAPELEQALAVLEAWSSAPTW